MEKKLIDGFKIIKGLEESLIIIEEEANSEMNKTTEFIFKPELYSFQNNLSKLYKE